MTLQEIMAERKLTDAALAEKAGLQRPYVTKIRRGKRRPSLGTAQAIARALDLPIEQVFAA